MPSTSWECAAGCDAQHHQSGNRRMPLRGLRSRRIGKFSRGWSLMAAYTIQPVSTGSFADAETSLLYYLADDRNAGVKIPAVYWMFLVRGEGVCFLVDSGPGDPEIWQQYHHAFE